MYYGNIFTQISILQMFTIRWGVKQEAQGLGDLLDKMEDNDHIKMDNRDLDVCFTLRPAVFDAQGFRKSEIHWMTPRITWSI